MEVQWEEYRGGVSDTVPFTSAGIFQAMEERGLGHEQLLSDKKVTGWIPRQEDLKLYSGYGGADNVSSGEICGGPGR